jgi:hypothetical protein
MILTDVRLGYLSVLTVGDLFATSDAVSWTSSWMEITPSERFVHIINFQRVARVGPIVHALVCQAAAINGISSAACFASGTPAAFG